MIVTREVDGHAPNIVRALVAGEIFVSKELAFCTTICYNIHMQNKIASVK